MCGFRCVCFWFVSVRRREECHDTARSRLCPGVICIHDEEKGRRRRVPSHICVYTDPSSVCNTVPSGTYIHISILSPLFTFPKKDARGPDGVHDLSGGGARAAARIPLPAADSGGADSRVEVRRGR